MHKLIRTQQVVAIGDLAQKREQLELFRGQFDATVGMLTQTVGDLGTLNENIGNTIQEIEDYQKRLEGVRLEMLETKSKNEKVIQNFKTLLDIE